MQLWTFRHDPDSGWTIPRLPATGGDHSLAIVFGPAGIGPGYGPLETLLRSRAAAPIIGCSTAGEIEGTGLHEGALVVALLRFEATRVRTALAPIPTAADSARAGRQIAEALDAPDLRAVIVLSEGVRVNGSALVEGINAALGPTVVVTGGLAGDGDRFAHTWVLVDGRPSTGFVSAAGLYGDRLRVGHGSRGGWDLFGPERRVTRSRRNVLYELDGRPALALYREYLGELAGGLPAAALRFPLALRAHAGDPHSVVRTVVGIDEVHQSMIFAGDIPEGHLAKLMCANFERLIDGAGEASGAAIGNPEDWPTPILSIAISCVGRRLVLGEMTEYELEAVLDGLPRGTRQIGFYAYGEISPQARGRCDLHNQTMTVTLLAEAGAGG